MAKYHIQTTNGEYEIETDEPSAPETYGSKLAANFWPSLKNAVNSTASAYKGLGMGQPDALAPIAEGEDPNKPFYGFRQTGKAIAGAFNKVIHPLQTFQEDPVGTIATIGQLASGAGGGVGDAGPATAVAGGAGRAAVGEVRPLMTGISPFQHPLKVLPDMYDAAKRIVAGGKQGLQDYRYQQMDKTPKVVAPVEHPAPPPITSIQSPLPSGRTIGPAPAPPPKPPPVARPLGGRIELAPPASQPTFETIQGPLPSGRQVGPAPPPPPRPAPTAVAPIEHAPPPPIESIKGPLPSGRKAGGIGNQKPFEPSPANKSGIESIPVPKPTVEGAVKKLDVEPREPYKSFSPSRVARQTTEQAGTKSTPSLSQRLKNDPAAMKAAKAFKKGTK